jgi:hypothetical protein
MKTIYIILVFCAGLFAGHLLFNNNHASDRLPVATGTALAQLKHTDTVKVKAGAVFKQRSDLLAGQLLIAGQQLNECRSELSAERKKVQHLRELIRSDTASAGDSLICQQFAAQIDTLNAITDSLTCAYENKLRLADSSIVLRDTQLKICDSSYNALRDLVQEQAGRERQLTEQIDQLLRQQKKKRLLNRFIAGGALFLSGLCTSILIHKQ